MNNITCDVLIVGAGPAGTTAAGYLLNAGLKVVVIEKQKFPRYIIGESLLPSSMEQWEEVGFLNLLKAQNYNIKKGARFIRYDGICNIDFSEKSFQGGWDWTWQVPREHFDKLLADEIEIRGAKIIYEVTAHHVKFSPNLSSLLVNTSHEEYQISAKFIIDSSGFGNVIPGLMGYEVFRFPDGKCAFYTLTQDAKKQRFKNPDLISFEVCELDLWFWCIPFSNGRTSIGFVGSEKYFKDIAKNGFKNMIAKHLIYYKSRFMEDEYLRKPCFHNTYSQRSSAPLYSDNYVLVGNNIGFLDPVFSSGVALATKSALRAAKLVLQKFKGKRVDFQTDYVDFMNEGIDVFRSYIEDWYSGDLQKLFFALDTNPQIKKEITSVLAGYVWDKTNRMVTRHKTAVKRLSR